MSTLLPPQEEAIIFTHYLIRNTPTQAHIALYTRALSSNTRPSSEKSFIAALQHPTLLPYLDAHDALFRPTSELRKRLYLMFSILEASPDFTDMFLPKKAPFWYIFILAGYGIRSTWRIVIGTLLVKVGGL